MPLRKLPEDAPLNPKRSWVLRFRRKSMPSDRNGSVGRAANVPPDALAADQSEPFLDVRLVDEPKDTDRLSPTARLWIIVSMAIASWGLLAIAIFLAIG